MNSLFEGEVAAAPYGYGSERYGSEDPARTPATPSQSNEVHVSPGISQGNPSGEARWTHIVYDLSPVTLTPAKTVGP